MVRPQVHSTKHYVQTSLSTVIAGAKSDIVLVDAVKVVDKNAVFEVEEGSTIKAIWIEEWIRSAEISPGSFIAALYKAPSGLAPMTTVQLAALGDADNKKNVFYTTQGLINDANADALNISKTWYKIPKSKQRFGLGDRLIWTIFAQGAIDLVRCGMTTYKEYT